MKWWILGVLAVLLAFCCIVGGIIAAIAIPNFLDAKERGSQKRAMADIKTLGDALGAYAEDSGGTFPDTGHEEGMYYTTVDAERLGEFLVPKYLATLPALDPWKKPYQYGVSPDNDSFIILCGGKDGQTKLEAVPEEPLETHCYEDDILWERDRFLQSPGGEQKSCR